MLTMLFHRLPTLSAAFCLLFLAGSVHAWQPEPADELVPEVVESKLLPIQSEEMPMLADSPLLMSAPPPVVDDSYQGSGYPGCCDSCDTCDACDPCCGGGGGFAPFSPLTDCRRPDWIFYASAVFMQRTSPYPLRFIDQPNGTDALNFDEFEFNYQPGVDVSMIRFLDDSQGFELRYFGLWNVHDTASTGPFPAGLTGINSTPVTPLRLPDLTFIDADYTSEVNSGEFNYRNRLGSRLTVLGGFRYLNLKETFRAEFDFPQIPTLETDINSRVNNDLYGLQAGVDGNIFTSANNRWRANVIAKAGIFYAHSTNQQSFRVIDDRFPNLGVFSSGTATDDGVAFVSEVGLTASYQVNCNIALQAGYQMLWLQDVAVASEQIRASGDALSPQTSAQIDNGGGALYHGFNGGLVISY